MGDGTNSVNHFLKDPLKAFREMQLTEIPPELQQQAVSHSGQEGDMWRLDIERSLKMFGWPMITLVIC